MSISRMLLSLGLSVGFLTSSLALSSSDRTEIPVHNKNTKNAKIKVVRAFYSGGTNCDAMKEATIDVFKGERLYIRFNPESEIASSITGKRTPTEELTSFAHCLIDVDFVADEGTKVAFNNINLTGWASLAVGHQFVADATLSFSGEVAAKTKYTTPPAKERHTRKFRPLQLGLSTKMYMLPCGGEFRITMDLFIELEGESDDPQGSMFQISKINGNQQAQGMDYAFKPKGCAE